MDNVILKIVDYWNKFCRLVSACLPAVVSRCAGFAAGVLIGVAIFLVGWVSGRYYGVSHAVKSSTGSGSGIVVETGHDLHKECAGARRPRKRFDRFKHWSGLTRKLKVKGKNAVGAVSGHSRAVLNGVFDQVQEANRDRGLSGRRLPIHGDVHKRRLGGLSDSKVGLNSKKSLKHGIAKSNHNTDVRRSRYVVSPKENNAIVETDLANLSGIVLLPDQQNKHYWLVVDLNRIPKFKLNSDSREPYCLRLYDTKCDPSVSFDNPSGSPIDSLQWKNVQNDTELLMQLRPNCYLAAVQFETADGANFHLKLQIVDMSGDSIAVNPDLHSWHSNELLVDGDSHRTTSTSVSEQYVADEKESSFVVRRAQVHMSSEEQSALAMQKVDELLEHDDLAGAIRKLYAMLGEFGVKQDITSMLVALLLETGQIEAAENVLDQGLRKLPHDPTFNELKAKTLIKKRTYEQAREHLGKMVVLTDIRQADLGSLALLGMVDYQLNRFEESALIYHELTRREPNKAAWWLGLGMSLENFGSPKAALEAYQRGLSIEGIPLEVRSSLSERVQQINTKR